MRILLFLSLPYIALHERSQSAGGIANLAVFNVLPDTYSKLKERGKNVFHVMPLDNISDKKVLFVYWQSGHYYSDYAHLGLGKLSPGS